MNWEVQSQGGLTIIHPSFYDHVEQITETTGNTSQERAARLREARGQCRLWRTPVPYCLCCCGLLSHAALWLGKVLLHSLLELLSMAQDSAVAQNSPKGVAVQCLYL